MNYNSYQIVLRNRCLSVSAKIPVYRAVNCQCNITLQIIVQAFTCYLFSKCDRVVWKRIQGIYDRSSDITCNCWLCQYAWCGNSLPARINSALCIGRKHCFQYRSCIFHSSFCLCRKTRIINSYWSTEFWSAFSEKCIRRRNIKLVYFVPGITNSRNRWILYQILSH